MTVVQDSPQPGYVEAEASFVDDDVRPGLPEQCLLADNVRSMGDEDKQEVERAGSDFDARAVLFEAALRWVQLVWAEANAASGIALDAANSPDCNTVLIMSVACHTGAFKSCRK